MHLQRWISSAYLITTLSAPAFGCFCFSTPMCSQIGALSRSRAVFIGRVAEVWPAPEVLARQQDLSRAQLRRLILQRWSGVLSAKEEQYIRTSPEWDRIEFRYAYMQRIRFVVTETFTGPEIHDIYTDSSSCGYSFKSNRVYLVDSSVDGTRYSTGACSRTASLESDDVIEDLKALRAWRSGSPLSPRIYGHILYSDLRPDIRIGLLRNQDERSLQPNPDGSFSFDGLEKAEYRLQIHDSRGMGERVLDLSRLGCFEATPWFSDLWHIAGTPVLLDLNSPPVH
jgi:hypothetical protein